MNILSVFAYAIGSSDNYARLWCIDSGTVEKEYAGHTKAVTSIAFMES